MHVRIELISSSLYIFNYGLHAAVIYKLVDVHGLPSMHSNNFIAEAE
jgi:hypothetical protein